MCDKQLKPMAQTNKVKYNLSENGSHKYFDMSKIIVNNNAKDIF